MSESRRPDPVLRFFGGAMVAVGALMFALCGLCTLTFLVTAIIPGGGRSFAVMALVIGGVPTAIGFGMMTLGHSIHQKHTPKAAPPRSE